MYMRRVEQAVESINGRMGHYLWPMTSPWSRINLAGTHLQTRRQTLTHRWFSRELMA